jgi:hypothetical protein
MLTGEVGEIEAVELVPREDQDEVLVLQVLVVQVLADGIGGALIPGLLVTGLLGGEDVDETTAETIELVGLLDVLMQRSRVELREDKDLVKTRIQAVADRDIDEAVIACERYRRLAAILRERVKTGTATAPHDDANDSRKGVHGRWDTNSLAPQGNLLKRKARMAA